MVELYDDTPFDSGAGASTVPYFYSNGTCTPTSTVLVPVSSKPGISASTTRYQCIKSFSAEQAFPHQILQ